MEKKLIRVAYTEKRLEFLDVLEPYLVLQDGRVLYKFDFFITKNLMFIRELDEFDKPVVPYKLWNFKGEDLTTYYNHISHIEYDVNLVYDAAREVKETDDPEIIEATVKEHYEKVLSMGGDDISESRKLIEESAEQERLENERRQKLMQEISDRTAHEEDALPSPEVLELRRQSQVPKILDINGN